MINVGGETEPSVCKVERSSGATKNLVRQWQLRALGRDVLLSDKPASAQADWQWGLRNLAADRRYLLSRFAGRCSPTRTP